MLRMIVVGVSLVVALVLPTQAGAALSPTDFKNASKFCKALKVEMTPSVFKATYGTNKNKSNAHGKCVSKHAKTVDQAHSNASKDCKAERAADPAAFAAKYGTNKNKSNALGKCISDKEDQENGETVVALAEAAKDCRSERAQDRAAFRDKYGTNRNKRNAFGKCVSRNAKNQTPNGTS
jgi:hypothetical protein